MDKEISYEINKRPIFNDPGDTYKKKWNKNSELIRISQLASVMVRPVSARSIG